MKLLALLVSIVVSIVNFPQDKIAGQEFEIVFNVTNTIPNSVYYGKALGGENFTKVDTFNSGGWFQQNSAWVNMPQFLSNSEGSISGTIKAKFDPQISPGPQQLKVRVRKSDDDTNYDSEAVNMNVTTPIPTAQPTNAPTNAPTQKPVTPIPTMSPTPKSTSTKSPSPDPTDVPKETFEPQVLAESTTKPIVESQDKNPKNIFLVLSVVIISLGIGLIGVASYMAYKIRYNNNDETKI